ncbi:MAG: type I-E CRISPR-associated protein Cse2/CasB [Nitrospirota bacterium]
MQQQKLPDFMALYNAWEKLSPGPKAELRRVGRPDDLIEVPAFYRLFSGRAVSEWDKEKFQRLIFCLPYIRHDGGDIGIGKALAKSSGVSEKRLFQVVRSNSPNDVIQLRRVLQMVEPTANWPKTAKLLWYWNDHSKRDLLEEYFINRAK